MTDNPTGGPREPGSQWYDGEAGPLVRPYAMTGGRTQPGPTGVRFDLIALVTLDPAAPALDDTALGPEHRTPDRPVPPGDPVRRRTRRGRGPSGRRGPGAPGGSPGTRLCDRQPPCTPAQLLDERVLREVIEGLRAL